MRFETQKGEETEVGHICILCEGDSDKRTVKRVTRFYCSTGEQKFTSGSFKPLFGLISSNWFISFVIVCTCLYVEQLPKQRPWLDISGEVKREEQCDDNRVSWWLDEPKDWCLRLPRLWMLWIQGRGKTWREHMTAVMLTSPSLVRKHFMSSRCYNYCTWKAGRGRRWKSEGNRGKKEKEGHPNPSLRQLLPWRGWAIYWPSRDALCQSGRGGGTAWRRDGGRGRRREGGQYEWVRVRGSVSLASLIMTYLLGLSVSPIAHTT